MSKYIVSGKTGVISRGRVFKPGDEFNLKEEFIIRDLLNRGIIALVPEPVPPATVKEAVVVDVEVVTKPVDEMPSDPALAPRVSVKPIYPKAKRVPVDPGPKDES